MTLSKQQQQRQSERLEFLEKRVRELADVIALHQTLERECQLQTVILETEPKETPKGLEHLNPWIPPRPDKSLTEGTRKLINDYPGMLFSANIHGWYVGLTQDRERIVFVPFSLYDAYEKECLQLVGWTPEGEDAWEEEISIEDEDTGEVSTPDIPDPLRRKGVWKARQVAYWTGETDIPELNYSVWPNGTWG